MLFNHLQSIPQQSLDYNSSVGFSSEAFQPNNPQGYLSALLSSVSQAKSTQGVEQAESAIRCFFEIQGFMRVIVDGLMEATRMNNYNVILLILTHLKNNVRSRWMPSSRIKVPISTSDKQQLMGVIIVLNDMFAKLQVQDQSYKFLKILKDIMQFMRLDLINLYGDVINAMNSYRFGVEDSTSISIVGCINILLGLSSQYLFSGEHFNAMYQEMIKQANKTLLAIICDGQQKLQRIYGEITSPQQQQLIRYYSESRRKFEQILYLSIKLISKSFQQECALRLREIGVEWADIAIRNISHEEAEFKNDPRSPMGSKGDAKFNFLHGKKWALKFLFSFIQKVAVYKKKNNEFNSLAINFYSSNMNTLMETFRACWNWQQPQKIKYYYMKLLYKLVESKPQTLLNNYGQELKGYLSVILPQFIIIDARAMNILFEQGAVQFINQEQGLKQLCQDNTNKRSMAVKLWCKIANMQDSNMRISKSIDLLIHSMQLLQSWTYEFTQTPEDQIKRDVGCILLQKMHLNYDHMCCSEIGIPLLNKIIIDNLRNSDCEHGFLLVGRAFQLANAYGAWVTVGTAEIIKNFIVSLYSSIGSHIQSVSNQQIYMMLRSTRALERSILKQIRVTDEEYEIVISTFLTLIRVTAHEDIMIALNVVIIKSIDRLRHMALGILRSLKNWFIEFVNMEKEASTDTVAYKQLQHHQSARGIIMVIESLTSLIRSGDAELIENIEEEIQCIFCEVVLNRTDNDDFYQYQQELMNLLQCFLKYYPGDRDLSLRMRRIIKIFVIKVAGVDTELIQQYRRDLVGYNRNEQQLFEFCMNSSTEFMFQLSTVMSMIKYLIRILKYDQHVTSFKIVSIDIFRDRTTTTQLFFYLIYRLFLINSQKDQSKNDQSKNGYLTIQQSKSYSVLLLVYYLENKYEKRNLLVNIHNSIMPQILNFIVRVFIDTKKYPKLAKLNVQLFSLWLFASQQNTLFSLGLILKEKSLVKFLSQIFVYGKYYGLPQLATHLQKLRCCLGIGTLIRYSCSDPFFWKCLQYANVGDLIRKGIDYCTDNHFGIDSFYDYDEEDDIDVMRYFQEGAAMDTKMMGQLSRKEEEEELEQIDGPVLIELHNDMSHFDEQEVVELEEDQMNVDGFSVLHSFNEVRYFLESLQLLSVKQPEFYQQHVWRNYREDVQDLANYLQEEEEDAEGQ